LCEAPEIDYILVLFEFYVQKERERKEIKENYRNEDRKDCGFLRKVRNVGSFFCIFITFFHFAPVNVNIQVDSLLKFM
jgi:hypothetical protein